MPEAGVVTNKETNITVADIVNSQPERVTVVTNDNFDAYVDKQLGVKKESPEEKAAAELAKVEAKKAVESDVESELTEHIPKDKKGKLNERFSELTAARKEAEAKAEKAAAEAKANREAKERAEQDAAALRAKYEPPKSEEIGPEPLPTQFTDVNEYAKAIKDWTAENTRKEDAQKANAARVAKEREEIGKAWTERQSAAKKEIPDYEAVIAESSVKVSDQVRDAILESDAGPQILYHLAKNADVAEKLGQMTVGRALKEIGRLEVSLGKPETKDTKEAKSEVKTTVAEISKAPAPITPLKGANAPVSTLRGTDDVPSGMTYEDWKKLYTAGKIK